MIQGDDNHLPQYILKLPTFFLPTMNFEKIPPFEDSKTLLDIAFSRARKRKDEKKFKGKPIDRAKNKEIIKLDLIQGYLDQRLDKVVKSYPSFDHLPMFYQKLIKLTLNPDDLKKAIATLSWARQKIKGFHRQYLRSIQKSQTYENVKLFQKQIYGRISSILRQTDTAIAYINNSRRTMKTFPDIKDGFFTICLYGFPNIGKTTLLNKLTGTNAKTAAYEFTTKSINVGYLKQDETDPSKITTAKSKKKKHQTGLVVQVCDVPGTLARPEKMNGIEMQAELVMNEVANLTVYLIDISQEYNIERQLKLYKKVKKQKTPMLTLFSKQDIVNAADIEEFKKDHKIKDISMEELTKEILSRAKSFYEREAAKVQEAKLSKKGLGK